MARTKRKHTSLKVLHIALKNLKKEITRRNSHISYISIPIVDINTRAVINDIIHTIRIQDLGQHYTGSMLASYHNVYIDNIEKIFKTQGYHDSLIQQAWNLVMIDEVHGS